MPLKVIETRLGRKLLKSTILMQDSKQVKMNIADPEETEVEVTFDPGYIVNYYQHEFDKEYKFNRTLIEFSHGGSMSIDCPIHEFEKTFLQL
jgi:hypothetical protein